MQNIATPGHPVIREIVRRLERAGREGPHGDGHSRLGLVVEGGGMRAAISGGMLIGMEELGCTGIFDAVYGESAGAFCGAYFLAGQGELGRRTYTEDLTDSRFINPFRLHRILDLDYLIDEVMAKVKPLDVERILRSSSRLFVSVTKAEDGRARVIDVQATAVPLLRILKATAAIIPLYSGAVELDDGCYVDGGIADPIPVGNAIAGGCTHILVLLTRPAGYRLTEWRRVRAPAARRLLCRRWSPELVHTFIHQRVWRYNRSRDLAFGRTAPGRPVSIAVLCPDGETPRVARLTRDPRRVQAAILYGRGRALELFRPA